MDTRTVNLRDLPEELVRRAKACAALNGLTLRDFVMQAINKATQEDLPAFAAAAHPLTATAVTSSIAPKKRAKCGK
jgi:hypothetical protein